jgi:prolipoprotein diacylglyceryltransferase
MNPGTPLHPAQLYASALGFAMFGILLAVDRVPRPRGFVFLLFLALYSVKRFTLDFVRAYEPGAFPIPALPLTLSQWLSLAVFLFAVTRLVRLRAESAAHA